MNRAELLGLARSQLSPGPEVIPSRPLGRTGERVSMIGLGGSHVGEPATRAAHA